MVSRPIQPISRYFRKEINKIYDDCYWKNYFSKGEKWVVDHIWPIRGNNSCGLHVPWNLRIIKFSENANKGTEDPDGIIRPYHR